MLLLLSNGMDAMLSGGLAKGRWAVLGMCDWKTCGDTFLQKSQGLVKKHSNFMQAVCTLLWIDCFETYMVKNYLLS